jgi:outer membrane cobalamin receptor
VNTVTPTTLISRQLIEQTPGADRTNGMEMITDFVPGAYMTHDMLHMRGGHQVSWLVDGVQVPQTNIASNLAAQIDPKDIDYLEVQRGSYSGDEGDRTYGIFNVVPKSGFDSNNNGELVLSAGNFFQTNDQVSFGSHTEKFAYYTSANLSRSDYGLAPPIGQVFHDATNGFGGFTSLIYNKTPMDQFRFVGSARTDFFQIPYDPDASDFENLQYNSSGLRDTQRENDAYGLLTWAHTFSPTTLLQVSPLYHYNLANYDPNVLDTPNATTVHRTSQYGGAQASISSEIANNYLQAGVFTYVQHDNLLFAVNPGLEPPVTGTQNGGLAEVFISDNYKVTPWLTILGGIRQSYFQGDKTDNVTSPRVGMAVEVPWLHWVFRGFYGRFYQAPPLITAASGLQGYANPNNTAIVGLHGERDEEHQFGVQIPLRGWMLDADTFQTRVNNFLDHSNIGESSIYLPLTTQGALIQAWEVTLRSAQLWHRGQLHLSYSNQIAQQRGPVTGGLICYDPTDPQACNAGFTYTPVDHDQRNTLNVGFNAALPWRIYGSTNVYYGSGFTNGDPDPTTPYPGNYLPAHTTFDLSAGRPIGDNWNVSVTALNVANRRVLLDNSLTFGGFHFNDPRQLYGEVKYRFHF